MYMHWKAVCKDPLMCFFPFYRVRGAQETQGDRCPCHWGKLDNVYKWHHVYLWNILASVKILFSSPLE